MLIGSGAACAIRLHHAVPTAAAALLSPVAKRAMRAGGRLAAPAFNAPGLRLPRHPLPPHPNSLSKAASGHPGGGTSQAEAPAPSPAQVCPRHMHAGSHCWSHEALEVAGLQSMPEVWAWAAEKYGEATAVEDVHHKPATVLTFKQLHQSMLRFAAGLRVLGVQPEDRVALFSESSGRWLVADGGIMTAGAVDAVRGVDSIADEELRFIVESSGAVAVVAHDARTLERLLPNLPASCTAAVVLWGEVPPSALEKAPHKLTVVGYEDLMERGMKFAGPGWQPPRASRDDLASLAYTSGTSGQPKAVMTSHANFLSQLIALDVLPVTPGDCAVTYLPPWHSYGRTLDYYLLSRGAKLHYSRLRDLKADLEKQQPNIFVSVPLLLDSLHSKAMQILHKVAGQEQLLEAAVKHVRAQRVLHGTALEYALAPPSTAQVTAANLAAALLRPLHVLGEHTVFQDLRRRLGFSRTRFVMSGGGSLTPDLDDFYEAIGVPVLVGYGLTETTPVLSVRHLDFNVRATIGPPIPDTAIRIACITNEEVELPDGQQGVIMASGPQVMSGYYQNPEATDKAFPLGRNAGNGWFDTGDLGWRVPYGVQGSRMGGNIVITGRQKDTIVLSSGENVEPQPLEDLLCASPYIQFAVVLGQNKRVLGALIVPSEEAVEAAVGDVRGQALHDLIQGEVERTLAMRAPHERVRSFQVLAEPFSIEGGTLTRSMKLRKAVIFAKYAQQVAEVEAELR